MKKHVRVYLSTFGYSGHEFVPCEVCGSRAVDIHHIERRGMGGSKSADKPENLMALCRDCHEKYGDKRDYKNFLKGVHNERLSRRP